MPRAASPSLETTGRREAKQVGVVASHTALLQGLVASVAASGVLAAPVPAQERGSNGEVANASVTEKAFRLYRWQEDYSYSYLAGKDRQGWDASWNVVRKVSVADSVYGPVGTLITAKNSTSLDVAQIGQVDVTWSVSRFLQLHALYSHVHAGQYIRSAGGRDFDYYRLQAMFRW